MWKGLAGAMAPGGFLIVGKAERPPAGLGLVPVCRCIYRLSPLPLAGEGPGVRAASCSNHEAILGRPLRDSTATEAFP